MKNLPEAIGNALRCSWIEGFLRRKRKMSSLIPSGAVNRTAEGKKKSTNPGLDLTLEITGPEEGDFGILVSCWFKLDKEGISQALASSSCFGLVLKTLYIRKRETKTYHHYHPIITVYLTIINKREPTWFSTLIIQCSPCLCLPSLNINSTTFYDAYDGHHTR